MEILLEIPLNKGGEKAKRQQSCSLQGVVLSFRRTPTDNPGGRFATAPFVFLRGTFIGPMAPRRETYSFLPLWPIQMLVQELKCPFAVDRVAPVEVFNLRFVFETQLNINVA
jgi:hypothetical protein